MIRYFGLVALEHLPEMVRQQEIARHWKAGDMIMLHQHSDRLLYITSTWYHFLLIFFFKDLLESSRSEMRAGKLQYHWEREVRSCSRSKELGKCNWCGRANKVTGDKALLHLCRHALEQKHSSNVAFCHIIPFLLNFNSWLFACLWLGNKAPLCAATQRGYLV